MTIPASQIVSVIPNVLSAGGNALQMLGICVTDNAILPFNVVESFPTATAVSAYFGASSVEYAKAQVYFAGFDNKTAVPAAMLFARWTDGGLPAFLRSGNVAALGLPAIQAMNGTLMATIDGYARTASALNLSSATSFTAAATLIASGLNGSLPTEASFTGAIAAETASVTASIAGYVMTVTNVASGTLIEGSAVSGTGVTSGTTLGAQLSGTAGGIGTYAVSKSQNVASETITATYGQLTVTVVASGTLSVGQEVVGGTTAAGTIITALGTGAGLMGTYFVNLTQTEVSGSLTTQPVPVAVAFDSVTNGFTITSGVTGAASSAAFATGSLAASLLMTGSTGAILSQGSEGLLPGAFMNDLVADTQNWATFFLMFDPDGSAGNTQKLLFSAWVNSTQDRFAYIAVDHDPTPTQSTNAAASMGQLLKASNSSGTILIYEPSTGGPYNHAPFVAGMAASIDFEATNGNITFFGKHQQGLVASVTDATTAANLDANGYNYYGAYATANQGFVFFNKGVVSGPFLWANTYINQIWLNNQLQLALMEFLTTINSVPYNSAGYAQIEAACLTVIQEGLNFGAYVPGVELSSSQIIEVNTAAGKNIAGTLQTQGWYFLVQPATPQVRAARQSPPCFFWYVDGGAVQHISLNSIDVQ